MNISTSPLSFSLLPLLFALATACSTSDSASSRGEIGKADRVGSCASSCGEQSANGSCFCDSDCNDYGDCCSDVVTACGSDFGGSCNDCLASGGTWQPEANECTTDCAIQDVSCFVDACPAPENACDDCLASGGTWQPEANQCTIDCAIQDVSCFVDACPAD